MKQNKKGLSDVITTVLIILLVLAAVVLIWGFIRQTLDKGGRQIANSADCFQLQIEPKGCVLEGTQNATVTVQWTGGDVNLNQLKLIVTNKDTGANVISNVSAPAMFGTASGKMNIGSVYGTNLVASTAGIVVTDNGDSVICQESQVTVKCA